MYMKIAVVGSGRMGTGIIKVLAQAYTDILWAGRNPEKIAAKIAELCLTERVRPVSHQAGLQADVIILTLWHRDTPAFVAQYRSLLAGKILVHIANPFTADFTGFTTAWDRSAAEEFAGMVPEARVVGAFKNTFWTIFDQPSFPEGASDCFVTSDDAAAKGAVMGLLQPLPFRVLDGGGLQNNRVIERMTLFSRELAVRYGHYPRTTWRLLGQAAAEADQPAKAHRQFLVTTTRTPQFDAAVLPEHYAYLKQAHQAGRVSLSGPFADYLGGAYLLTADSRVEAAEFAAADPLVQAGASTTAIREWLIRD